MGSYPLSGLFLPLLLLRSTQEKAGRAHSSCPLLLLLLLQRTEQLMMGSPWPLGLPCHRFAERCARDDAPFIYHANVGLAFGVCPLSVAHSGGGRQRVKLSCVSCCLSMGSTQNAILYPSLEDKIGLAG